MTKHTPGPWTAKPDDYRKDIIFIKAGPNVSIARIWHNAEDNANARLIAAAPALLEALELLLSRCESMDQSATHDGLQNIDALVKVRAAIAKAKGE